MLKRILLIVPLMGITLVTYAAKTQGNSAAVKAAAAWLQLVDARQYETSWKQTAPLFQHAVSEQQWAEKLQAAREPFGKLVARRLLDARYFVRLPGAPDGQYWLIEENADFAHKSAALETITMALVDGQWKPIGYFIR